MALKKYRFSCSFINFLRKIAVIFGIQKVFSPSRGGEGVGDVSSVLKNNLIKVVFV